MREDSSRDVGRKKPDVSSAELELFEGVCVGMDCDCDKDRDPGEGFGMDMIGALISAESLLSRFNCEDKGACFERKTGVVTGFG